MALAVISAATVLGLVSAGSYALSAGTCGYDVCVGDSWQTAYAAAEPGAVLTVQPGTHPPQTLSYITAKETATSRVVLDATGATMASLNQNGTQHLEIRGLTITGLWNIRPSTGSSWTPSSKAATDLVFSRINGKTFLWRNVANLTLKDSSFGDWDASVQNLGPPKVGAYPAEGGATQANSSGVVIDNVLFHDMIRTITGTAHAECFYFDAGVDGLTIRDSTFTNCAVFAIFSNGQVTGRPITNVLIESNMLDVSRNGTGGTSGSTVNLKGGASNWTFRGNSILGQGGTLRNDTAGYPGFVFERNAVQNASCGWIGSATWTGNVMSAPCGGSQQANPVGFVSASLAPCDLATCYRNDLHVKPDSRAGLAGAGVPISGAPPPPPPPPPPPTCPGSTLTLTKISEDATTVTFSWVPPASVEWYLFYADATRVSNAPAVDKAGTVKTSIRFAKGVTCYRVKALGVIADGGAPG